MTPRVAASIADDDSILKKIADRNTSSTEEDYVTKYPQFGDELEENAEEVTEYESNLAVEENLEKTLRDINSSLKRIDEGTYGICKYCNKEIDEKRLEARPVSSACMSCKSKILKQ
mgnify:CR=1 FL=1